MHHKGNLLLMTGVAPHLPLCLSDCLSTAMVYIGHSYTADLSCCPEELIYSEIYWAELPRFVMTDSRGEEECGDRTQHSDYRTPKTKLLNFPKCSIYCCPAPDKRTWDSPECTITKFRASWSNNVAPKSKNNVQWEHSAWENVVDQQRWAKTRQPSIFIML